MSINAISTQISNLVNMVQTSGKNLDLAPGDLEIMRQLLSMLKNMVSDGIQDHEVHKLGEVLKELGDIIGGEFKRVVDDIVKKLKKVMASQDENNADALAGGLGAQTQGYGLDTSKMDNKSDASAIETDLADLNKNNMNKDQLKRLPLDMQRDIAEDIVKHLTDLLLEQLTDYLSDKHILKFADDDNQISPIQSSQAGAQNPPGNSFG